MVVETFRAFFAIDLPPEIKKTIFNISKPLRQGRDFNRIKWIKPKNLHLTLCFLGNITYHQSQIVAEKVSNLIQTLDPFILELDSIQLFPKPKNPHAIALIPKLSTKLEKLASNIKQAATKSKIKVENREFKPHITIARINRVNNLQKIIPKNFTKIKPIAISFQVTTLKLFKSEPQAKGSVYIPVTVYQLPKMKI